jgi:hypothetical protein
MKKMITSFAALLGIVLLPVFAWSGETIKEETIKEDVLVVNVEVPVRVFLDGQPVDNLGKDDFLLYEGKKQQRINGFFKKKRKIGNPAELSNSETGSLSYLAPRYFVLNFRISAYNRELQESLRYMFAKILRVSDRLLVFANEKQLFFSELQDKDNILAEIDAVLLQQAQLTRSRLFTTMKILYRSCYLFLHFFCQFHFIS